MRRWWATLGLAAGFFIIAFPVLAPAALATEQQRRAHCLAFLLDEERLAFSTLKEPTVQWKGRIETEDPRGPRYRLERIGDLPWYSSHSINPNAIQADPRGFIFALGDLQAAEFFGFELHADRKRALVPSAQRANWAMDAIEDAARKGGGEPLRFVFRPRRVSGFVEDRQYIRDFAVRGVQPLAEGTSEGLHDLAYHLAASLVPEREAEQGMRMSRAVLGFVDYLEKTHPRLAKHPTTAQEIRNLLTLEGNQIDTGTGNFGFSMARNFTEDLFEKGVLKLVQNGISPEQYLQNRVAKFFSQDVSVQLLVRDYVREQRAADPAFNKKFVIEAADFRARLEKRRARIVEIVRKLQK